MTKLEQLRDIAKRLEEATGPNEDIDKDSHELFYWPLQPHEQLIGRTSSIDAARALVERLLRGWLWSTGWDGDDHFCILTSPARHAEDDVERTAPTAPLAILKALFAALIQQEESK